MVAAFKNNEQDDHSSTEEESQDDSEEVSENVKDQRFGALERMPCVIHTLQLVVNIIHKEASVKRLLDKQLLNLSGLTLIKDCPTRWSSTYLMITQLIDLKDPLTQVADRMG
ncbi:hypothetical protein F2P79_006179 [Pimephales promelas]|nr:hypothetical protein F2P79_006179 [Pimephales promelas]